MKARKSVILIVDDDMRGRDSLRFTLADGGFDARTAANGVEALESARASPPDLVISDLLMPVMDGYTLLRRWKADNLLSPIPFIVYSGTYTGKDDQQLALDLGADAYILKPASLAEIKSHITAALQAASKAPARPSPPGAAKQETATLRKYSETLGHKLEEKQLQLESENHRLEEAVAERERAEAARRADHRRLRELIDGLGPDLFIGLLSPEGVVLDANRSALAAAGLRREDVLGRPVEDTYWFSYSKEVQQQLRDAVRRAANGEDCRYDVQVRLTNDQFGTIDLSIHPLHDESGRGNFLVPSASVITERKRAEQRLQESERRFREIFESANVGIALASPDDRFLAVNAGFAAMVGYSRDELLQMHTFDLVHPDDVAESRRLTAAVHDGCADAHRAERRYLKKDGAAIWVSVFSTTVFDENHRENYSVGVVSDITERRLAEVALRASEERFSKAFKSGPLAMSISMLADGRFVDVNDAFLAMFGYGREEVVGRTSLELGMWFSSADREVLAAELREKGRFRGREYSFRTSTGEPGWASCSAEIIHLGDSPAVISMFNDFTERRRAELALAESEYRASLILKSVHDGVFIAQDERFVYGNPGLAWILGCAQEDIPGLDFAALVAPEFLPLWTSRFRERIAGGNPPSRYEVQFVRQNGTERIWVELHAVLSEFNGRPAVLGTIKDITEQKRVETALRASEERLRLALDAALMGIFDWDVVSGAATWSPRHEKLFGLAPGTFNGTYAAFERQLHPDDVPGVRDELARCRARHEHFNREFRVLWPDGSTHWIQAQGEFFPGPGGEPMRMRGVVMETTARRNSEEVLTLFRNLLDRSNDSIEVVDPDTGRFLDVNEKFCRDLGYSREEALGLRVSDIEPVVEQLTWEKNVEGLKKSGSAIVEGAHRRKDGSTYPVEISINWMHLDRDYIVAIVRDISERKRAEQVVTESQRRLATLVENLPGVVYRSRNDEHWTTEFVSDSIVAVTGYPASDFIQGRRQFGQLMHPDDKGRVWEEIQESLKHKRPFELVYRIRTASRTEQWIWEQGRGVFDASGSLLALEGYIANITAQKQAEVSIRRLNRIYAVLSGINSLIVRERDRQRLFDEACRIAVDSGHFELVWIGTVDNIAPSIVPVARRGSEADLNLIAGVNFTPILKKPRGKGTVVEAVRSLKPVFRNDLTQEQDTHPKLREMCDRGYRSVISLPLLVHGACAAVMVLYSKEAGFFDLDELKLLSELAGDLSFALEYMEQEEKVNFLAFHDPLTGLPNRTHLHTRLTSALENASAQSRSCALVLMNFNNFHEINNTLGHQNGDLLLQQIARSLRESVWGSDLVACLGGDEFAILLPRLASSEDIELVLRKISTSLRSTFTAGGIPISLEARIGYAIFPDQADNADLLWQRAGVALRAAKEQHASQMMYDKGIDYYDPRRLALVSGFQKAIDTDELVLHYQPKIDLQRECVIGVEVLLRWQHAKRGLLYPDAFIPLVEHTGLIDPMTTWVLANAMRQARSWDRAGINLDIAVNLSVRNLQNPNLISEITDLARSSRFPLDRLTLEITESAIMVDPERGKSVLNMLHETGIRFSMDDFGIGQSSLGYLKDLPITQLKIDKSFVMGFREPRNAAIVRAALELGHNLGMQVTAEGIEDEATFEALCELGCDTGQGYFFSKALPPDKLSTWLRKSKWKPAAD